MDESAVVEKLRDPCLIVIFGATGDLASRKLIPSLFRLFRKGWLPEHFAILGVSAQDISTDAFIQRMNEAVIKNSLPEVVEPSSLKDFDKRVSYTSAHFEDPLSFKRLRERIEEAEAREQLPGNRLFYLAIPPKFISSVAKGLGENDLGRKNDAIWTRIVVEKPYGHDLKSSRELSRDLKRHFSEDQIYRIDHYLGKETVQNIMVLRFANGIFEPVWNRRYVDSIQISVSEDIGVERRGNYYEKIGALRDMVPSHLFQLLCLIAMEPPASFEADAVRNEYTKVLHSIIPIAPEDVLKKTVRGQYGAGVIAGSEVPPYRSEPDVSPESGTETYAALKMTIENWRWAGVPFYLRTGKRLKERVTEVAIRFRSAPVSLFRGTSTGHLECNWLVLNIQPGEGISLSFGAKAPGPSVEVRSVRMDYKREDFFGAYPTTGYETLLYDCIKGDSTLFRSEKQVDLAWQIITPILDVWSAIPSRDFPNYAAGTWGPPSADHILVEDGRFWRTPS